MKVKRLKVFAAFLRLTITALVLTCLLSTLVPVSVIASILGIGAMACCRNKSAGHCHAPVKVKRHTVKSEVMCGLKTPTAEESTVEDDDHSPQTTEVPTSLQSLTNATLTVAVVLSAQLNNRNALSSSQLLVTRLI